MRSVRRFFDEGDKVKVTLRFRGREMAHQDIGFKLLQRVKTETAPIAKVEAEPLMEGRQMIMVLAPKIAMTVSAHEAIGPRFAVDFRPRRPRPSARGEQELTTAPTYVDAESAAGRRAAETTSVGVIVRRSAPRTCSTT